MGSGKLLLKNIIIGENSTMIHTNNGLFVVDIEKTSDVDPTSTSTGNLNKWNSVDKSDETIIHNIFPVTDFKQQSYQYSKKPSEQTNDYTDFVELFSPQIGYKSICQYRNYAYGLTLPTTSGSTYSDYGLSDTIYAEPTITIAENTPRCYVYPSVDIIQSDLTSGNNTIIPLYNLTDISYNYMCEFPLDLRYYNYGILQSKSPYSDYLYYSTYCDMITCKNEFDFWYGMESKITSGTTTSEVSATVDFCRNYYDINSTGGIVYMTFRNEDFYKTSGTVDLTPYDITFGFTPSSAFTLTGEIAPIPLINRDLETDILSSGPLSSSVAPLYDNVEIVKSINRIQHEIQHKSNVFSINIQNANINENINLTDEEKARIKLFVNNSIYSIVKKITPANTQLLNIYWTGV